MMWVKFKRDFDHRITPMQIAAYKKDAHINIPKDHAEAAIEAGAAEATDHKGQSGDAKDGQQSVRKEK